MDRNAGPSAALRFVQDDGLFKTVRASHLRNWPGVCGWKLWAIVEMRCGVGILPLRQAQGQNDLLRVCCDSL